MSEIRTEDIPLYMDGLQPSQQSEAFAKGYDERLCSYFIWKKGDGEKGLFGCGGQIKTDRSI